MASRAERVAEGGAPGSSSTIRPLARSSSSPPRTRARPRARGRSGCRRPRRPRRSRGRSRTGRRPAAAPRRGSSAAAGTSASSASSRPSCPARSRPPDSQRAGELLDEERDAAGAVVQRGGEAARGRASPSSRSGSRRACRAQRLERQLAQQAVAAQVVAQPPQLMRARDLVGPVGGDHEHRQLAQRGGERGEQLERGVVGPLQVVEEHRGRRSAATAASPQRIASNSVGRSLSRIGVAELGEQQREVRAQGAAARQPVRHGAQELAQGGGHRLVGRRAGPAAPRRKLHVGASDDLLGEARLADARLAGQQDQRAAAVACLGEHAPRARPLGSRSISARLIGESHGGVYRAAGRPHQRG